MAIQPPTEQEQADLRAVIESLGSGHFTASKIHHQHRVLVATDGRKPMHPVRLGQVLAEYGAIAKPKWDKYKPRKEGKRPGYMVKGWLI